MQINLLSATVWAFICILRSEVESQQQCREWSAWSNCMDLTGGPEKFSFDTKALGCEVVVVVILVFIGVSFFTQPLSYFYLRIIFTIFITTFEIAGPHTE